MYQLPLAYMTVLRGRACRPSRSEFSEVFPEIRLNMGKDLLERLHTHTHTEGTFPTGSGPKCEQLALPLQP